MNGVGACRHDSYLLVVGPRDSGAGGLHSIRPLDIADQMGRSRIEMIGRRVRYSELIATPEPVTTAEPF